MKPIYLDYAATTPLDPCVARKMQDCLLQPDLFGNPASLHSYGQAARAAVETAREQVAIAMGATPSEIIWTSGATESNNLALKGAAYLYQRKGKHIVTMQTEHKAVLDVCQHLEREGFEVTYLKPDANGLLASDTLEQALRKDTILVSIMHVNNETGVIQDLQTIAHLTSARGILLHVDAAQSIGKLAWDVATLPVDLVSLSAHKVYGPKGIGALYLRKKPRVRVAPLLHGGGHEQGMRSGTLATHQIVGMGEAFAIAHRMLATEPLQIATLREQLLEGLKNIPELQLNTTAVTVPHILNLRFTGMLAQAVVAALPQIACSTVAACQGQQHESSYVLRAMGMSDEVSKSSLRISMGRFTTKDEIAVVVQAITELWKV